MIYGNHMIIRLFFASLLMMALTASFAAEHGSKPALQVQIEERKAPTGKSHKRRRSQPEGVFSVDIVSYDNRLHLLTGRHHQGQKSLWYRYSDDGGVRWSVENKVLNSDDLPVRASRGNDAQIVAQGETVVVTWTKFDPQARFNSGPMLAARSVDGGQSWQQAVAPPDWKKGPHGFADMVADDQFMHAVWLDSRKGKGVGKGGQGVRYARSNDGGLSWQSNITADGHSCSCCWNKMTTDGEGNTYLLYRDKEPSDLSIGVMNAQKQWKRLNHVGAFNWQFDGCPHIGGGLDFQTVAGKKRLHSVVGTGHPDHLGVHYLYSDDSGENWSVTKQLGDESAIHADIAAHDDGRTVAVWDMMGEAGLAIFSAESKDRGKSWSPARQLSKKAMRASHPRIVTTENGFLIVWTESDGHQQQLVMRRQ